MKIPTIRLQKTGFVLFLTLFLFGPGCSAPVEEGPKESAMTETATLTRHPGGAGFWYPASPEELSQEIDNFIASASDCPPPGKIVALVSPHAGYRYSGPVAGAAFRQVQNRKFDTVVVVGLSHRIPVSKASVFDGEYYETPLGKLPVDRETTGQLLAHSDLFEYNKAAHSTRKSLMESGGEHSVENQVPFLQRAIGEFKMVEILTNAENADLCHHAGLAIAEALQGKNALLVASTDLTHWPRYEDAVRVDRKALEILSDLDPKNIWKELRVLEQENADVHNLSCVMCSKAAVLTVFEAAIALGADRAAVLDYRNSGDTAGGKSQVVGYGAMALYDLESPPQPVEQAKSAEEKPEALTDEQKKTLLSIARQTLEAVTQGKPIPETESSDPVLNEYRGCFVTLTEKGQLRGCIGRFDADLPLHRMVADMAESAALKDPRFNPVRPEEVPEIDIEITVFPENPRKKITDIEEIEVGRHGLYIKQGRFGGTLLPQVASERGWDRITFLEQTCQKAFLPKDAWKDPRTEIYVYPGEIFHEEGAE